MLAKRNCGASGHGCTYEKTDRGTLKKTALASGSGRFLRGGKISLSKFPSQILLMVQMLVQPSLRLHPPDHFLDEQDLTTFVPLTPPEGKLEDIEKKHVKTIHYFRCTSESFIKEIS
jgi:hypothetical protein